MNISDNRQFIAAKLAERLREIDPTTDVGNGTTLADAAATVLSYDLEAAGKSPNQVDRIPYAKLEAAMKLVGQLIASESDDTAPLPWGLQVKVDRAGRLTLPNVSLLLVAGVPGMHDEDAAPAGTGIQGRLLVERIHQEMKILGVTGMDLSHTRQINGRSEHDQWIRFAPQPDVSGSVLEVPLAGSSIDWLLTSQLPELARGVAVAAQQYWNDRGPIAKRVAELSVETSRALLGLGYAGAPMRLVRMVVIKTSWALDLVDYGVEIEALGDDLRPVIITDNSRGGGDLVRRLPRAMRGQVELGQLWIRARDADASGWIDDAALRLIDACGIPLQTVLDGIDRNSTFQLEDERSAGVTISGRLRWRGGRICCDNVRVGDVAVLCDRDLRIDQRISETLMMSLPGRRAESLIDVPMLKAASILDVAPDEFGGTVATLVMPMHAIDRTTLTARR